MKIVALLLIRNEEWIIGCSLDAALRWCDGAAILLDRCTDRTREIVARVAHESGKPCSIREVSGEEHWLEMDLRQRLLDLGREMGGTHFAMIDADEILTANLLPVIREWCDQLLPVGGLVLELPMIPVWDGLDHYRKDDSVWSNSMLSLIFRDKPDMAWAARGDEKYHFHNRVPSNWTRRIYANVPKGGVMHLQWAQWGRVVAKHRWYKINERIRWPQYAVADIDAKYNQAVERRGVSREDVPADWWGDYRRDRIKLNLEPWHDAESLQWIEKQGWDYFAGLDLLGWSKP